MFHFFHTAVGRKVSENPMYIAGMLFPDICSFSNGFISEKESHSCGDKIEKYFEKHDKRYIPFARGIKAHKIVDDLAEKNYAGTGRGYVYACWGRAAEKFPFLHMLTELWVDSKLAQWQPETAEFAQCCIKEMNMEDLTVHIVRALGKEDILTYNSIKKYYLEIVPSYARGIISPLNRIGSLIPSKLNNIKFLDDCVVEVEKSF